jgi:acyl transferase domain-containing protein
MKAASKTRFNITGWWCIPLSMMEPAREELEAAIEGDFRYSSCPVYQNVTATAVSSPEEIKKNLIIQLTAPVKWTQSVQQMIADGATLFTEVGPGKVLAGLIAKIDRSSYCKCVIVSVSVFLFNLTYSINQTFFCRKPSL